MGHRGEPERGRTRYKALVCQVWNGHPLMGIVDRAEKKATDKQGLPVCRSFREPFDFKINRLGDTFLVESGAVRGLHDVRRLVHF